MAQKLGAGHFNFILQPFKIIHSDFIFSPNPSKLCKILHKVLNFGNYFPVYFMAKKGTYVITI